MKVICATDARSVSDS